MSVTIGRSRPLHSRTSQSKPLAARVAELVERSGLNGRPGPQEKIRNEAENREDPSYVLGNAEASPEGKGRAGGGHPYVARPGKAAADPRTCEQEAGGESEGHKEKSAA